MLGVEPPSLQPDANGIVGFTIVHQGARVELVEREWAGQPGMLMLVELGRLPADGELEILRGLMEANFLMSGLEGAAFALDPCTGEVSFRESFALSRLDAHALYRSIEAAAGAVQQWKEEAFLEAPAAHEAPACPAPSLDNLA
jgi:hypothetical protein